MNDASLPRSGRTSGARPGSDADLEALVDELTELERQLDDVRPSARRLGVVSTVLVGAAVLPAALGATRWGVLGALAIGGLICLIGYVPRYLHARALERSIAALERRVTE